MATGAIGYASEDEANAFLNKIGTGNDWIEFRMCPYVRKEG